MNNIAEWLNKRISVAQNMFYNFDEYNYFHFLYVSKLKALLFHTVFIFNQNEQIFRYKFLIDKR